MLLLLSVGILKINMRWSIWNVCDAIDHTVGVCRDFLNWCPPDWVLCSLATVLAEGMHRSIVTELPSGCVINYCKMHTSTVERLGYAGHAGASRLWINIKNWPYYDDVIGNSAAAKISLGQLRQLSELRFICGWWLLTYCVMIVCGAGTDASNTRLREGSEAAGKFGRTSPIPNRPTPTPTAMVLLGVILTV